MKNIDTTPSSIVIALIGIAGIVVLAIAFFGAQAVEAFAGVMSFGAAVIVALATITYVKKTGEMVEVSRRNAELQARVAAVMEKDLAIRIAPNLRFISRGGALTDQAAVIQNIGSGVAVDVRGKITYQPTARFEDIPERVLLEARDEMPSRTSLQPNERGFTVRLECTDSIGLNDYRFEWAHDNSLISATTKPHVARE